MLAANKNHVFQSSGVGEYESGDRVFSARLSFLLVFAPQHPQISDHVTVPGPKFQVKKSPEVYIVLGQPKRKPLTRQVF